MTSTTRRYLAVTYLVFYVVAVPIERRGFGRGPMSPIDRILTAPILWCFVVYGVQTGSVMGRFFLGRSLRASIYRLDHRHVGVSVWTVFVLLGHTRYFSMKS